MKLLVHEHTIEIEKSPVNEKEINISKCEFVFDEAITDEYVKKALFTLDKGSTYEVTITNNECDIPQEVLQQKGTITIGVVATLLDGNEYVKRYNPSPAHLGTWEGSLKQATNSEPITPTDKEQIEQRLNEVEDEMDNLDVDAEKVEHTTTITITKKDGTEKTVQVLDGEKGDKGDKGEPGSIKFIVVQTLPTQDIQEDAMYLVPLATPDTQGNNYAEYIYVNGTWELLGKIGVQVDLTDYVKNTDYPTSATGGVIKSGNNYYSYGVSNGYLRASSLSYASYQNTGNNDFISKGTLENVITGKELVNKTYVDGLVGDIDTALDLINGEVVN